MTILKKNIEDQPELNLEQAGKILENVFEANHVEPNTIPLEVLTSYSNYRKERFSLQRLIIVIIMVLFLMMPFLFIPAEFTVQVNADAKDVNPTYTMKVTSPMAVKRINASIDGRNVPVYETDSHVYSIEPTVNGRMILTLTLLNNQTTTRYIDVKNIDLNAPTVVSSNVDNEQVYLYVSDEGSGVDYEHIEAVQTDGTVIKPSSFDKKSGCIVFSYPEDSLNIYIPDFAKNKLQLVLTLK